MSWEGFMELERKQLRQRCEGKLRGTFGTPLQGETVEQLDRIGERDRLRAEQGLVSIKGEGGRISYRHKADLSSLDMRFRIAAERVTAGWLRERKERRRRREESPPIRQHLG
jgi:hypothetical protein